MNDPINDSFNSLIGRLTAKWETNSKSGSDVEYDVGEFCYHLVSILMETQKLLNKKDFSGLYIEEHCNTLGRYAKQIGKEVSSYE